MPFYLRFGRTFFASHGIRLPARSMCDSTPICDHRITDTIDKHESLFRLILCMFQRIYMREPGIERSENGRQRNRGRAPMLIMLLLKRLQSYYSTLAGAQRPKKRRAKNGSKKSFRKFFFDSK